MTEALSQLFLPPEFNEGHYESFKKEIEVWKLLKHFKPEEQGPIVFRCLKGRAKTAALELSTEDIGSATGLKKILDKLDKIYEPEINLRICAALDKFESFRRAPSCNMSDFILDFDRLHNMVKTHKITYPDGVLAYRLMKAANMSSEHEKLLRATVTTGEWSYDSVLNQLRKIFNDISHVKSNNENILPFERPIKVEDTYYNSNRPMFQEDHFNYNDFDEYESIEYNDFEHENSDEVCYLQNNDSEDYDVYYGPSKNYNTQKWSQQRNFRTRLPNQNRYNPRPTPVQNGPQRTNIYSPQQNVSKQNLYKMNPKDFRGNPTVCGKCRSTYHWWRDCPHVSPEEKMKSPQNRIFYNSNRTSQYNQDLYVALFQKSTPTLADEVVCLLGETINKAVIDSGCTKTCCGQEWFNAYLETMTEDEIKLLKTEESQAVFRFGDSAPVNSIKKVLLPIKIQNVDLLLETEIVPSNIPLLLSKNTMKKAKAQMDYEDDKIKLFGQYQPMMCTSSGHYAIPISKNTELLDKEGSAQSEIILLATQESKDKAAIARKLHTQFSHPTPKRLNKLIETSGIQDEELKREIQNVSNECDICKRYRKTLPKPVVSFPLASEFNETIAMDLKIYKNNDIYFLHIVDHATRFSAATVIKSKKAEVIIDAFFKSWICIFGTPQKVLSDNGGEFANAQFIDLCQNYNINFITTAAEAPWSNGLVEKHNHIIGEAVSKIKEDINCSLEVALCWAVNAKNALQNVYGFSPYQLVFGKNPNLPSVLHNELPALEGMSSSEIVANNLNAMHRAREEFVRLESSEKIRRALRSQTRVHNNIRYLSGENVFYKREDENKWRGPGKVIGQDGSKVLIKIPTGLLSVHTCRVILTSDAEKKRLEGGEMKIEETPVNNTDALGDENYDSNNETNNIAISVRHQFPNIPPEPYLHNETQGQDVPKDLPMLVEENDDNIEENINADYAGNNESEEENENDIENEDTELEGNNESEEENENDIENEDTELEGTHKSSNLLHSKDLPKEHQKVKYKEKESNEWKECQILSRGGKASGKYKFCLNIKNLEDDSTRCIDWKDSIDEWEVIEENVMMNTNKNLDFAEAKQKELDSWKKLNVYEQVENEGQYCISVRWVLTEKEVGEQKVQKARLVARGYEEEFEGPKDSPTGAKESLRTVIGIISSKMWKINALDIKSAFLQGKQLDRNIYLKPPKEAMCPGKLWRLNRCVYGLNDASRFWYFRVKDELTKLSCKSSKYDSSLFIYRYEGKLEGLLFAHVDDFMWAGTNNFKELVIDKLKQTFQVSKEYSNDFKYLGLEIHQGKEGIYVSQQSYLNKLKEIEILPERSLERDSPLNDNERKELRQAIGQLNWLSTQTRPDLAFDVCDLSTSLKEGTVDLIIKTNKVIKKAKYNNLFLYYPVLNLHELQIRCFADASFGNLRNGGSQGGHYIELVSGNRTCPIEWQSVRIKRTPKSTLAAETLAMVEAIESAYLVSKLLSEILFNDMKTVPIEAITDNLSLFESAHGTTNGKDRRLRIEMSILREGLKRQEYSLKWTQSGNQLADCLTKRDADPRKFLTHITGKLIK